MSSVQTKYKKTRNITYEVINVELLPSEESSSSNGVDSTPSKSIEVLYPLAKLLKNVEKSYDKGKKTLKENIKMIPIVK